MLIDAILAAEPYMKIAEQIEDPKRFVHLTDSIKSTIEATTTPVGSPVSHSLLTAYRLRVYRNCRRPATYSTA